MTQSENPGGRGGPVPQPVTYPVSQRAKGEEYKERRPKPFIVAGLAFMLVSLGIMFVAILLMSSCPPRISLAVDKLEQKQVSDIRTALEGMLADPDIRAELTSPEVQRHAGQDLYEVAFKRKLLKNSLIPKLVSLRSLTDQKAGTEWLDDNGEFPPNACSYTAPKAGELADVLGRSGSDRCVVLTFNARNWRNYSDDSVIVLWSDDEIGEWFTFEEAEQEWGITEDEWADPAGMLFGKKAPFQFTYE